MLAALDEYDTMGRRRFLKKYGFGRASKYFVLHNEQLYDTKPLIASAHKHATGVALRRNQFKGGAQTKAVFERLRKADSRFASSQFFEDQFGELRNRKREFHLIPGENVRFQTLGFSDWVDFGYFSELKTTRFPGVYAVLASRSPPSGKTITDRAIVYIGETVAQSLKERLSQFYRSLDGRRGRSGARRLHAKTERRRKLWLSIRPFPLDPRYEYDAARDLRSAQIRMLERVMLFRFVDANRHYPLGNGK